MNDKYKKQVAAKAEKVPVAEGTFMRFPRALREVARVSVYGSEKYNTPVFSTDFLRVPGAETTYANAEARHILGEAREGPINYDDGELLHKAQKAWNALADLEVFLYQQEHLEHPPMYDLVFNATVDTDTDPGDEI